MAVIDTLSDYQPFDFPVYPGTSFRKNGVLRIIRSIVGSGPDAVYYVEMYPTRGMLGRSESEMREILSGAEIVE